MQQNSQEWINWRGKGIGSSDVAAIINCSPYQTPLQLWRIKVGLAEYDAENSAMYRGKKYEDKARACFELLSDREFNPITFQSAEFPYMRVSLDGWHEESRTILEIKTPSHKTLEMAQNGEMPPHYMAQVQYQLFVANGSQAIYFAFDPESEQGFEVNVMPDIPYIADMVQKVSEFWIRVQTNNPPPPTDRDYIDFPRDFEELVEAFKVAKQFNEKPQMANFKDLIIRKMTHPKMKGFGLSVSRKTDGGYLFRTDPSELNQSS